MAPDGHPTILSANVTRGLGGKTSLSAALKNVFRETASLSGIQPAQSNNIYLLFPETLVSYSAFKSSLVSGPGAQAGRQQQAVLCGGRAPFARCDGHQDAGPDGAEGLTVELRAEAQIRCGRWVAETHTV